MEMNEKLFASKADLMSAGITKHRRNQLLRSGELVRVRAGRFVAGASDEDPWRARLRQLLVRAGPTAVLSRTTAAALWRLDGFEDRRELHANVARNATARGDATIHRVRDFHDIRTIDGLPVTGPSATLLELGAALSARPRFRGDADPLTPEDLVELALESALREQLADLDELGSLVRNTAPQHLGRRVLAAVLGRRPIGAPCTESHLETRVVQVLRDGGLPPLDRQVWVDDAEGARIGRVDFVIGRVVIEADGEEYHPDFQLDRERWVRLDEAGYIVRPFTSMQVERRTKWTVERVKAALRKV